MGCQGRQRQEWQVQQIRVCARNTVEDSTAQSSSKRVNPYGRRNLDNNRIRNSGSLGTEAKKENKAEKQVTISCQESFSYRDPIPELFTNPIVAEKAYKYAEFKKNAMDFRRVRMVPNRTDGGDWRGQRASRIGEQSI